MNDSDKDPRKNEITENGVPENTVLHDREQEILLVEWYGPDDPEASHSISKLYDIQ
jgi:DHA1 family multidrug resistance protein-like MFS transporter